LENSQAITGHFESADLIGKLPSSKVYEDKVGCVVVITKDDTYRAQTKHMNINGGITLKTKHWCF
jgi:hypothetical protein